MPRTILTPQIRRTLSEFPKDLDEYALIRYFTLTNLDRQSIFNCRGNHNRLGFACQLCWLRWLGWQPDHSTGAPPRATDFLAEQLHLPPESLSGYPSHQRLWQLHATQVRQHLGWRTYGTIEVKELTEWLSEEALQYDNPRGLLEAAMGHLRGVKVVRPGITLLERLVMTTRARAETHLGHLIDKRLTDEQKKGLDALIAPAGLGETTPLQFIKEPPSKASAKSLLILLDKIDRLRALGVETLDLSVLNPNRRRALAREAQRLFPIDLRRFKPAHRYALLACLLSELLLATNDQAVETHEQLMQETNNRSVGRRNADVIKRGETLNIHVRLLHQIGQTLLDNNIQDGDLRPAIFKIVSRTKLAETVKECELLAQPDDYNYLAYLVRSYNYIRQFGPRFLTTLTLRSTEASETLFKAVDYLRRLESGQQVDFTQPPTDFIPYKLRKSIIDVEGQVNRKLWEITLHYQLVQSLKAGEVWVEHSIEHAPLSHDIQVTSATKTAFLQRNPHLKDADQFFRDRQTVYLETLKRANRLWPELDDVSFEEGRIYLSRLQAKEEPEGTEVARQRLAAFLPRRKLSEVFREVLHWLDYLQPLREMASSDVRLENLDQRLLALIMAEGCNIGLTNMANATPGLTYIQLARVASRCLDEHSLEKAIASIINFYDRQPIAHVWGEGIWSSADGQLVLAPVKMLHARLHPRAPKGKRVINLFTYIYDRLMPYWGRVIGTTAHESAYEIDGLLHHVADIHPTRQAVDTAGYTDNVFGLASLLSIFYAPRIKDMADQRLFYLDKADTKTFEHVGPLLKEKINTHFAKSQWNHLIELAATVEQGIAPAARVLRKLEAAGEHNDLYRALREVGRLDKTVYLLSYLTDPELRRQVERQLNKTENYNSLANVISSGNKGEMRLPDLRDQLNRASALRLVASIIILFNAAYMQAGVRKLRESGYAITDEQLAHIFPTLTAHINFLGE